MYGCHNLQVHSNTDSTNVSVVSSLYSAVLYNCVQSVLFLPPPALPSDLIFYNGNIFEKSNNQQVISGFKLDLIFNFSRIFKYNLYRKFLTPDTPGFLFMWIIQLLPCNRLNKNGLIDFMFFQIYLVKNILLSDTKYV